jgi:hypothetical protein
MLPVALLYSEIVLNTFDMFYFEVLLLLLVLFRLLSDSDEEDEDYFLFTNFPSIDIVSLLTD